MPTKEAAQQALPPATCRLSRASELCCFGTLTCILLAIVHLFQERLGFFLVHEGQPSKTFLGFEGMEESPVLVI